MRKKASNLKPGEIVLSRRLTALLLVSSLLTQLAMPAWGQEVEYIHTDALGSPVAVTDANRNVIERSEYEPYGQLLNRPLKDGPGYTGHVLDAGTGLNYMQQRYYDSQIGRFLSVDPVTANGSTGANFNRYWYANNNPYKFTDPDGREAFLNWTAPDQVELTVTYSLDQSQAASSTSPAAINAQFASDYSGTVEIGNTNVQVTAKAVQSPTGKATLSVVPKTQGVTKSGREETDKVGGNKVTVGASTGPKIVSHELGHVAGAGDQYVGGVNAKGQQVTTPGPGNNVMQDLRGPANGQSLKEVVTAPTNKNTCAPNVSAASGGC